MRIRWIPAALAVALCAACAAGTERPAAPSGSATRTTSAPVTSSPATTPPSPASLTTEIENWKVRAGDHFTASGAALEEVARASEAEDESGLWSGCQQLHDANSIGLQDDLPTPDRRLTAELQQMIDDINTATHACLRFVLGRNPAEADTYREYLDRAVDHLQRAKVILSDLEAK